MEWRLSSEDVPYVSTAEFHADRGRAKHLEEEWSQPRLRKALEFVTQAVELGSSTVSDLGCGDGGLLSLIKQVPGALCWGYDFCPANSEGWPERGVTAKSLDVFGSDQHQVKLGQTVVMTEVLEHLADPHAALGWVRQTSEHLVCSSPWNERPGNHSPEHAWAWDLEGYAAMIQSAGWTIVRHEQASLFQVVLARA